GGPRRPGCRRRRYGDGSGRCHRRSPPRPRSCRETGPRRARCGGGGAHLGCRAGAAPAGGAVPVKYLELLAALVIGGGLAVGVINVFVRWEREGKEHLVPLVLLGLLIIESTLYSDQNSLALSIFHPGAGSTRIRLAEIYIVLALVARLIARGRPRRIGLPAGLWMAFAAWIVVGAVEGHLYHNLFSEY